MFLSSRIDFLERYVLLSEIVGPNYNKFKMVFIYGFKQSKQEFGFTA